jgi:hypothetical protein
VPHTVEFIVRSSMFVDALRTTRDALTGRGFSIAEDHARGFVATRGSERLTTVFGALVSKQRQFVRLHVDGSHRPYSHSVVLVRAGDAGAAVAGGPIGARRREEVHRWVSDGIERSLSATGALISRLDDHQQRY